MNDFEFCGEVEHISGSGDAFIEHDIELRGAEGRRNFVFNNLDTGAIADDFITHFDRLDAAHIEPNGGVELKGIPSGGGLGVAEHHTDFLAKLVGEDDSGLGLVDGAGKLAKRLRHEPCLHAHCSITHVTLNFRARNESSN